MSVALRRMDIFAATMSMSGFRASPREGHLARLKKDFAYLIIHPKTSSKFRTNRVILQVTEHSGIRMIRARVY